MRVGLCLVGLAGLLLWLAACGEEARPSSTPTAAANLAPTPDIYTIPVTATLSVPIPPGPTAPPSPFPPTATPVPPTATPAPTPGPAVAGDLPAPPAGRKLSLTIAMLQRLQQQLGGRFGNADLSGLASASYASPGLPADLFDYYRQAMRQKGWTESQAYDNRFGIYFVKGSQVALVSATAIPDDITLGFLAGFVPEIRGQVKGGETLLLLGQGPAKTFEILKKP